MVIVKNRNEIADCIASSKRDGSTIGFVPTMGALHMGHVSLISEALKHTDIVVCSIFINPLQFNDAKDFERYPKTLDADLKLLKECGCSIVFVPDVNEVYAHEDNVCFDFGALDQVMEGVFRPGHFLGMAKVVKRLFDIVKPDTAFFGEKDYQQLAIIRKFTLDLNLPVKIVGCPTVRESDGLAMSSRNQLLNQHQRDLAPFIYKILCEAKVKVANHTVQGLKDYVGKAIQSIDQFQLEYFEVADAMSLEPIKDWKESKNCMGFIVVRVGTVRLIDNILLASLT